MNDEYDRRDKQRKACFPPRRFPARRRAARPRAASARPAFARSRGTC